MPGETRWPKSLDRTIYRQSTSHLLRFVVHGRVLYRRMNFAEPRRLRICGTSLGGSLADRVHQLPVRVGGIKSSKPGGHVLTNSNLRKIVAKGRGTS